MEGERQENDRVWEESSYASSDISDWTQEAGIDLNNILRKRTKRRNRFVYCFYYCFDVVTCTVVGI